MLLQERMMDRNCVNYWHLYIIFNRKKHNSKNVSLHRDHGLAVDQLQKK